MSFFVNARKRVYVNADADLQKNLVNEGGDTLYYGTSTVSSSLNDGSLASGESVTIGQGKWLISAGQSKVDAFELPESEASERTVDVLNVATLFGAVARSTTDVTDRVNEALAEAQSTGASLYFPTPAAGENYRFEGQLTVNRRGIRIFGDNPWLTVLKQVDPTEHLFSIVDDAVDATEIASQELIIFEKLRLLGAGATATGDGIHAASDGDYLVLRDCTVYRFNNGVYADGWSQCSFENSSIAYNNAWGVSTAKTDSSANTIRFANTGVGRNGTGGWFHEGGGGCTVDGGDWVQQPVAMKLGTGVGNPSQVTLTGGNFEAVTGSGTEFIQCLSGTDFTSIGTQFQPQITGGQAADCIKNTGASVVVINPGVSQSGIGAGKAIVNNAGAADLSRVLFPVGSLSAGNAVIAVRTPNGSVQHCEFYSQPDNAVPSANAVYRGMPMFVEGRDGISARDKLLFYARDRTTGSDVHTIYELSGRLQAGSVAWDPPSLADGATTTTTVTVTGAAVGDFALGSFDRDITGCTITAAVTAANTVTITLLNKSGGTIDFTSGTARASVIRR